MKRNIIKIRAICMFGWNNIVFDYIRYEDETPDKTRVWKSTRRHHDDDIVEIGEIWINPIEDMSEPCWNAYCILDGNTGRGTILKKAEELYARCKEWMKNDVHAFIDKIESSSFDAEKLNKKIDEYNIKN